MQDSEFEMKKQGEAEKHMEERERGIRVEMDEKEEQRSAGREHGEIDGKRVTIQACDWT